MNLWAKSLRQLCFAVALFFFSCEDENSFLGFPTERGNQKFNVSFIEIPLPSSTVLIDSIPTDNRTAASVVQIGKYFDPLMGPVTATAYLQFVPIAAPVIPATAVYDSVTVQFRYNFYGYGFTGEQTHRFTIHELTDTLDRYTRHEFDNTIGYDPTPIGEFSKTVRYDSLKEQLGLATGQDTLLVTARIFGATGIRMFRLLQSYPFSGPNSQLVASEYRDFINTVKGIAVVPTENNGIVGIRILDGFSKVTLHYHNLNSSSGAVDTLARTSIFNSPSFTNISIDRSASELGALTYYQNMPPSTFGTRYAQSGAPVVTRIDLDSFYQFADTVENVIINEAELVLGGASSNTGLEAHSSLGLKLMNANNQFINNKVDADSTAMSGYHYVIEANTYHYFVQSDQPSTNPIRAGLVYDSDESHFAGYMTFFVQSLLRKKNDADGINEQRVKHMAVYPNTPAIGYSVNRSTFDASQVKLRIYYTRPNVNANP
jgi:hypothetical protein